MAVQVQREQLEHCRVALTIEVPPEDIQKAVDTVFNQVARRTNVPGFRPGKAPKHLLKRFIDEGRVQEMAMDRALTNAYRDALEQTGVVPYRDAEPQVELPEENLDPEKGFSFKATVALQPHVHLGDLEGLSARRVLTRVADEDVLAEIQRYCERGASFEPTEEAAADGDRIRATVRALVDGEPVPDLTYETPAIMQIGSNLEEFDAGLTGIRAGEERTFDFTYPEDFPDEALSGKTATTTVNTVEVLRRTVPEATDEFAQKLGLENLDALKTRVQEMLQAQADALADQDLNDSLIREVVNRATVHYPDEMVEREVSAQMEDLIRNLESRSLTLQDYLAAQKQDLAQLQTELREQALQRLSTTLVLLDLARENEITVTEKDVESEVKARAEAEDVKLSQMRRLLNDTGEIDTIRNRIFFRKITELLREKAEIREVEG